MVPSRFTPRAVMLLLASEIFLLVGLIVTAKIGLISRHVYVENLIGLGYGAAARGIALKLFLDIAGEYRDMRLSRLAWQALAINAGLLFFKGVASSGVMEFFVANYPHSPLRGFLNHILGVPASIFLLLGILGMLLAYRRAGLSPKLGIRDYAVIVIPVLLFGWVLIFHKKLEEGQSPWMINRLLQPIDLFLIGVASILSIVLHRYAASLSGGKLAKALRWLVIYGLMPGVLVLVVQVAVPAIQPTLPFDPTPLDRLWALIPWMMTLAAAVRAEMTADAVAQVAKLQRVERPVGVPVEGLST